MGREAFFAAAEGKDRLVRCFRMLRQWEDGEDVCSLYELDVETPAGAASLVMSEWHTVRDGRLPRPSWSSTRPCATRAAIELEPRTRQAALVTLPEPEASPPRPVQHREASRSAGLPPPRRVRRRALSDQRARGSLAGVRVATPDRCWRRHRRARLRRRHAHREHECLGIGGGSRRLHLPLGTPTDHAPPAAMVRAIVGAVPRSVGGSVPAPSPRLARPRSAWPCSGAIAASSAWRIGTMFATARRWRPRSTTMSC